MKRMHGAMIVLLAAGAAGTAGAVERNTERFGREAWNWMGGKARPVDEVPAVTASVEVAAPMSAEATQAKAKQLYEKLAAQPELKPSEVESAEYVAFVYGPESSYIYNHFFAVAVMDSKFAVLEQGRDSGMLQLDYYGGITVAFSRSDKAGETLRAHTDSPDATRKSGMMTGWPETGGRLVRMEKDDYKWALELAKLLQTR